MIRVIHFNPTEPGEAAQFLNEKQSKGWEFISVSGCYYYFKTCDIKENINFDLESDIDHDEKILKKLCEFNALSCHLSNYIVFRKNEDKTEIFCIAGSDIIDAENIISYMNNKEDGFKYFRSNEILDLS